MQLSVYSTMKPAAQTPLAKPATHWHEYAFKGTATADVESVHTAPLTHGLLMHSTISISQFPLIITLHSVKYSSMISLVHIPFA